MFDLWESMSVAGQLVESESAVGHQSTAQLSASHLDLVRCSQQPHVSMRQWASGASTVEVDPPQCCETPCHLRSMDASHLDLVRRLPRPCALMLRLAWLASKVEVEPPPSHEMQRPPCSAEEAVTIVWSWSWSWSTRTWAVAVATAETEATAQRRCPTMAFLLHYMRE